MKRWEYCNKRRYYAFATNILYGHIMLPPKKLFFLPLPKKNASCCFYTGYYEVSRILWWTSLLWFCDKPISWQYHTLPPKNNFFGSLEKKNGFLLLWYWISSCEETLQWPSLLCVWDKAILWSYHTPPKNLKSVNPLKWIYPLINI